MNITSPGEVPARGESWILNGDGRIPTRSAGDREVVVPDRGSSAYSQGYKEGYYDREHNRWWHAQAWHDCVENDIHCH